MRESPASHGGGPSHHLDTFSYASGDQSGSQNAGAKNGGEDGLGKRRKKKKDDKVIKSEEIDNYQGNKTLDELLLFLGDNNETNKKKIATSEDIASKSQKANKKTKDKKQKSPTAVASSSTETGLAATDQVDAETISVTTNNMGNISGKSNIDGPKQNGDLSEFYRNDKMSMLNNKKGNGVTSKGKSGSTSALETGPSVEVKQAFPSKNNTKTVAVQDCFNDVESKTGNKKTPKETKLENPNLLGSKSEENGKCESIIVKQKNAKNKKTKPSSPTVKTESECSISQNIHIDQDCSDLPDIDTNFIFTDLYVPPVPKEDEFQVVGKKKKKSTVKETPVTHGFSSSSAFKQARHSEEKRLSLTNSVQRSNHKTGSVPMPAADSEHLRDLSPSSFPALTGARARQQEGRRNSTGDVQIPIGLKAQDDSDIESVKSLPATQATGAEALSPRLSYAKMAAVTAKPTDMITDSQMTNVDTSDSETDPKKAVWKGSPTERRHSIGSSPEEMTKNSLNKDNAIVTNSAKGYSQDHILADAALKPVKPVCQSKTNAWGMSSTVGSSVPAPASAVLPDCVQFSSERPSLLEDKVKSSGIEGTLSFLSDPSPGVCCSQPELSKSSTHSIDTNYVNSSSNTSKLFNVDNNYVYKHDSHKARSSNGTNNKKQKSVIFLDKRVEQSSSNLGISFGFEIDSLEKSKSESHSSKLDSDQQLTFLSECSSECSSVISESMTDSVDSKDTRSTCLASHSSSSSVISDPGDKDGNISGSNSDSNKQDQISKTQVPRINGVVSHAQGVTGNHVINADSSADVTPAEEEPAPAPGADSDAASVYYGEWVWAMKKGVTGPSPVNGPTQYCGLARFFKHDERKGTFNVSEAAYFLTRGMYY